MPASSRRRRIWSSPSTSKRSTRRRQKLVSAEQAPEQPRGPVLGGDQALGMEVGDAVDQPAPPQELQRHQQMDQERRRAGEQDAVGRAHRPNAASTSRRLVRIVHSSRVTSEPRGTGRACSRISVRLPSPTVAAHDRCRRRREADQRHLVAALGEVLGAHLHVLPDRAEIRRQPVGNDDDPPLASPDRTDFAPAARSCARPPCPRWPIDRARSCAPATASQP